jgi:hypothetical protein
MRRSGVSQRRPDAPRHQQGRPAEQRWWWVARAVKIWPMKSRSGTVIKSTVQPP